MFNLGGEDKEKLEENMEEIKQLVNSEDPKDQPQQNSPEQIPDNTPQDDSEEFEEPEPDFEPEPDLVDQNEQIKEPNDLEFEDQDFDSGSAMENINIDNSDVERQNTVKQRDDQFKANLENISNEVKELNKSATSPEPSKSGGDTLFIEVDEFQEIRERVEEMKYLSHEVKDLMSGLEDGLDEDRRMESEAQNVVNDFSDRRKAIESAIR